MNAPLSKLERVVQPNNAAPNGPPRRAAADLREFQAWLSRANAEQKTAAVYQLLHNLLGDQPDQEIGVYNPDEEVYLYLLPPRLRAELRFAANPELERELEKSAVEPMAPLDEVLRQYGARGLCAKTMGASGAPELQEMLLSYGASISKNKPRCRGRTGRHSLHPLSVDDALRGLLTVPPMAQEPAAEQTPRKSKKPVTRAHLKRLLQLSRQDDWPESFFSLTLLRCRDHDR